MTVSLEQRIARATYLIDRFPEAREILEFYLDLVSLRQPEHGSLTERVRLQLRMEAEALRANVRPDATTPTCPFCHSKPVVAVLRGEGDGGKRSLQCGLCATEWLYRRVLCPNCGEEHKDNLPIYTVEGLNWVRIEACDSCKTYLKAVDLTRDGHAIPVVDEIATVTLGIWAEEHGYAKLEPNLLGM